MNYADEDYVRFYTRETITWLSLEYEGQAVMSLMLHGKFNRSGIFDCGGHEPSHAVTLATRCPREVAEKGLKRLLDTGTWVLNNGQLIWPNYVQAQTCKRSDRSRKRESRENLALEAMSKPSHAVTRGHTRSHAVTPKPKPKQKPKPKPRPKGGERGGESPPHLTLVESQPAKPEQPPEPAAGTEPVVDRSAPPPADETLTLQQRSAVWLRDKTRAALVAPRPEAWAEVTRINDRLAQLFGHTRRVKLTSLEDPRVKKLVELWAVGVSFQDTLDALEGSFHDDYVRRTPPRQTVGWIFDNAERVQEMIGKSPAVSKSSPGTPRARPRKPDPDEEALAARRREENDRKAREASPGERAAAEAQALAIKEMRGGLFVPGKT